MSALASTLATSLRANGPRAGTSRPRQPARRGSAVVTMAKKSKSAIRVVTPGEPEPESPTPLTEEQMNSLPPEMKEKDMWDAEGFDQLGETVKNWGLFFVVFIAVGAGVVAANTYNDGAIGVDFQAYDSPDQAVAAALKEGVVSAEPVLEAPAP